MNLHSGSPLVSVIIPCYNSEDYIDECISSVLNQTYKNIEIIVVDDGSTDMSLDVLNRFKNLKVLRQDNSGACVARNNGLKKSKGKYIKFLDSDDFLEIDIIKKQVLLAEDSSEDTIFYGDCYLFKNIDRYYQELFVGDEDQAAKLLIKDIFTPTPLHRKWMLEKVGGFDERFRNGQEWNLHVRLASEGFIFKHHEDPVFNYRIHDSSSRISNGSRETVDGLLYEIKKTKMTIEKIGHNISTRFSEALAFRYWWIARSLLRIGQLKESRILFKESKSLSLDYKYYWPVYYKVVYAFLGLYLGEAFFKILYFFRKPKYK